MQRININNNNKYNKITTNNMMHNNNINKHQQRDAPAMWPTNTNTNNMIH
jgi:hypothetical protein